MLLLLLLVLLLLPDRTAVDRARLCCRWRAPTTSTLLLLLLTHLASLRYGDYSPVSPAGRFVVMVIICVFMVVVPSELLKLSALLEKRDKADEHYLPTTAHIIVACPAACRGVPTFLHEYIHDDHAEDDGGVGSAPPSVVLLVPASPDAYWKGIVHKAGAALRARPGGHVEYLVRFRRRCSSGGRGRSLPSPSRAPLARVARHCSHRGRAAP